MLPLNVRAWVYDGIVSFCHFEVDVEQHVTTCNNTDLHSVDLFFTWIYLCAQCGTDESSFLSHLASANVEMTSWWQTTLQGFLWESPAG